MQDQLGRKSHPVIFLIPSQFPRDDFSQLPIGPSQITADLEGQRVFAKTGGSLCMRIEDLTKENEREGRKKVYEAGGGGALGGTSQLRRSDVSCQPEKFV
jgi:hypothetical protein